LSVKLDVQIVDRALAVVSIIICAIVGIELARGHVQPALAPFAAAWAIAYAIGVIVWIRHADRPSPTAFVLSLKLIQLAILGAVAAVYLFRAGSQLIRS
jgi:hypothetical protein